MIRGYESSDEDDDDYDYFGYSEPLIINKSRTVPLPEIKNLDFKEKLNAALQENELNQLFLEAIEQEDFSALRDLLELGVDVDKSPPQEWTPLMKACVMGKSAVVRFLLENGSDPNKHKELFTPLMACCTHTLVSEDLKLRCLRLLLQEGANVNATDKYRTTALMYATGSGYVSIVTELLQTPGIDVNVQDKEGWTALFYAINHNNVEEVEKLICAGTDLTLKDNCGRTAVQLALDKDLKDLAEMLGYVEEVYPKLPPKEVLLSSRYLGELPDSDGKGGFYSDARNILASFSQLNVKDISLPDLLNATEKDLYNIGVKLEFDRFKILTKGIHRIHLEPWKKSSMINLTEGFTLSMENVIAITGTMVRHLTVINASLKYLDTRVSTRQKKELIDLNVENDLVKVLADSYVVAEKLKVLLLKIFKHSEQIGHEVSPDYIYPQSKKKSIRKKFLWCALGGAATAGLLVYCCRTNFQLKPAVLSVNSN